MAEHEYGEDDPATRAPVAVDAAAAVPPFDRGRACQGLWSHCSPRRRRRRRPPGTPQCTRPVSGVTLGEIHAALGSYVDAAAVQAAIGRQNSQHPSQPIDASSPVHRRRARGVCSPVPEEVLPRQTAARRAGGRVDTRQPRPRRPNRSRVSRWSPAPCPGARAPRPARWAGPGRHFR